MTAYLSDGSVMIGTKAQVRRALRFELAAFPGTKYRFSRPYSKEELDTFFAEYLRRFHL